jgi:hypothetical protein
VVGVVHGVPVAPVRTVHGVERTVGGSTSRVGHSTLPVEVVGSERTRPLRALGSAVVVHDVPAATDRVAPSAPGGSAASSSGAGTAGPSPAPPGASAVMFASLLAALAALLLAFSNAAPAVRSVRLVSLVERPG